MPRLSVLQRNAFLGLLALLIASLAAAAPARQETPTRAIAPESAVQQLWSLWSSFWSPLMASLDEGCHVDPNGGGCATRPSVEPAATPDAGCHVDPNGLCGSRS